MRVLLTRPQRESEEFAERLAAAGHEAIISPVFEIEALQHSLLNVAVCDGLVATSAHALELLADCDLDDGLRTKPLWLVGERTAQAARAQGFSHVAHLAADAQSLATHFLQSAKQPARLIYLAGRDRKPVLEQALEAQGILVSVCEIYAARETAALSPQAVAHLSRNTIEAVLHFSRRSAEILVRQAQASEQEALQKSLQDALHVCLSDDVARGLAGLAPRQVRVAVSPSAAAMIAALERGPEGCAPRWND